MLKTLVVAALAVFACSSTASAQLQVPNIGGAVGQGLPEAPLGGVRDTAQDLTQNAGGDLRNLRQTTMQTLLRAHRDVIDTDPRGALIVRNEVVAIAPSEAALTAARARGFSVRDSVDASDLGLTLVVLAAPNGMSTRRALATLRQLDPQGSYDFNHLYFGAGAQQAAPTQPAGSRGTPGAVRVGLIDTGVDTNHRALADVAIQQRGFAGPQPRVDAHGTAVASLVSGADGAFHGAAPGASLFVADVYSGQPTGGGAVAIVAALAWLAQAHVSVINVSLVGPQNRALEAGIRAAIARGIVIVAAVGNDGPSAPPLYPASYQGVIGVTGVDARNRVLPEAGRGAQVDFAAPGADISAAAPGGRYVAVRGTSFAAPIVAGLIARDLGARGVAAHAQADLARQAVDLGARGVDTTYGAGLVGGDVRSAVAMARR